MIQTGRHLVLLNLAIFVLNLVLTSSFSPALFHYPFITTNNMMLTQMVHRLLPKFGRATNIMATKTMATTTTTSTIKYTSSQTACNYNYLGRGVLGGIEIVPKRSIFPSISSTSGILQNLSFTTTTSITPYSHQQHTHTQTRGFASKKHKAVLRQSKGFRGRANRCFRVAIRRLEKSWQYAYRDRKVKKREFRKLWIQRLNAGVRQYGLSYSNFINMQGKSGVVLDRKILSGLAMYEPFSFKAVVDVVKHQQSAGK